VALAIPKFYQQKTMFAGNADYEYPFDWTE